MWEYDSAPLPGFGANVKEFLDEWGTEGWELIIIDDGICYFKRAKRHPLFRYAVDYSDVNATLPLEDYG